MTDNPLHRDRLLAAKKYNQGLMMSAANCGIYKVPEYEAIEAALSFLLDPQVTDEMIRAAERNGQSYSGDFVAMIHALTGVEK